MDIIEYLLNYLACKKITQVNFAEKIGYGETYISKILNKNATISKKFKIRFKLAFGFPLEDLPRIIKNETADSVIAYKIAKPSAHTKLSAKEFMSKNEKLNAAIIGMLPLLGFDNKKELLKHIHETYFIPLEEEWDGDERRKEQMPFNGNDKRKEKTPIYKV